MIVVTRQLFLTLPKGEFKHGKFSKKRAFCHKMIFRQSKDKFLPEYIFHSQESGNFLRGLLWKSQNSNRVVEVLCDSIATEI
jgi:hypothetical protein